MKWTHLGSLISLTGLAGACLLPEERDPNYVRPDITARQSGSGKAVGRGDRFRGGAVFPRGVGSGNSTDTSTILNVNEVNSGLQGLATEYGVQLVTAPYKTYGGASTLLGKVGSTGGTCNEMYRIYLNGNIHARERGSADNVLYFISDLLYAQKHNTGLTYGSKSYTNANVKTALGAGIVFLPLINPDGVAYDQSSNSCWRKNRNPASSTGSAASIGVDLNRNFDFVWDLSKFAPSVRNDVASSSASSEVFHGTAAFSEPETKNMKWVMDTFSKIRWFIDLHSYAGDVLYSWGSDTDQSTTPAKNFLNTTYNAQRGITSDSPATAYGEYIPTQDLADARNVGVRMGNAMSGSTGRTYTVMQAAGLYATSGASDDYSYSRHFANPSLNKIYGYTIEFGFGNNAVSCPFYPTDAQYLQNLRETNAGFMDFILGAVATGLGDPQTC